ncbi:hypothetical protein R83H12_00526 [Fibrobacteria bacterium R8-3-H12]
MNNVQQTDILPKTIWHYTKIGVLEKIFPSRENEEYKLGENGNPKIRLRFTNCKYSKNDPSEPLVLQDLLLKNEKDIIEKYGCSEYFFDELIKKSEKHFQSFVFSMSRLKDSFAFWSKEYAGTDGIAIGLDEKKFKDLVEDLGYGMFSDVNYDESIKNVYDIIDLQYKTYKDTFILLSKKNSCKLPSEFISLKFFLDCSSSNYKFMSWKHEQEVRATLMEIGENQNEIKATIEFVENRITKCFYKNFDKDIVKSIMLGPACNNEHIEAVKEYLTENGYDKIDVSRSKAFDLRRKN